jgi:DNA-binding NtrC family response regulator
MDSSSRETNPLLFPSGQEIRLKLRSLRWEVLEGPDQGRQFQTEDDPVRIGSSGRSSIVLKDSTVSRHHAVVTSGPDGLILKDLGSRNGTFVEGMRVYEILLPERATIRLGSTVLRFTVRSDEHRVVPTLREEFHGLVGQSPAMLSLFAMLEKIATHDVTTILTGETGCGKELCARALHTASRRSKAPFVVLDCSSLDRELGGSELFGHEAGAFTGAVRQRRGAFEQAEGGTIFVDELGELPLDLQVKLLRVLERRELKRLGGDTPINIDCRIVAATHRDLPAMVKAGQFRQDLYFRFAQIMIRVPPLRERREDIPILASRFLKEINQGNPNAATLTPAASEYLKTLELAGNVRELRNIIHRGCAMATGGKITPQDLGQDTLPATGAAAHGHDPTDAVDPNSSGAVNARAQMDQMEKQIIIDCLTRNSFNRTWAARELGISVPTLRSRMKQYGIRATVRIEKDAK